MKKFSYLCAFFLILMHTLAAIDNADRSKMEAVINGYIRAWNEYEGHGFADGYTDDADFVNIYGMHFTSKTEIEERHIRILQTFLKGSIFTALSTHFREVEPDLVLAFVHWSVEGFRSRNAPNGPGETREGIFTHVFVKQNNEWKITAAQNTLMPQ